MSKGLEFDRRLYVARRVFEQSNDNTYVVSFSSRTIVSVSYTHLDVYKRQALGRPVSRSRLAAAVVQSLEQYYQKFLEREDLSLMKMCIRDRRCSFR